MTSITKSECEAVIERLVDKTLSFGCRVKVRSCTDKQIEDVKISWEVYSNWDSSEPGIDSELWDIIEILGHPILIGGVLEQIAERYRLDEFPNEQAHESHLYQYSEVPKCCELWHACGFTRSLQDILAETEMDGDNITGPAADLFRLLHTIFLTTE